MWLYRHHTYGDIVDLNHETGQWRLIDETEKPAGAVIADLPVRGSYEDEGERRFYKYWTSDERLVFRTPEGKVFPLFQEDQDGRITALLPGVHVQLVQPARYHDRRLCNDPVKTCSGVTFES